MITYDEALTILLKDIAPLSSERVSLDAASGRFLAEPVAAAIDSPRSDVSSMDGYAVRQAEARSGAWLKVVGDARPGAPYLGEARTGEAVRIFTGAQVPDGADWVAIQEEAEREGKKVRIKPSFGPARYIRQAGSDFSQGQTLLERGTRLTPTALVSLAGADHAEANVTRKPAVSIIATGDELVPPGEAAASAYGIPDSGSFGVSAMIESTGGRVVSRERGEDRLDVLQQLAARSLKQSDLVVVIGGASVGDRDFAKPMFEREGLDLLFSKVAIKPGKPVWFGTAGKKLVLGLPGNPGSAMVTARLFLTPLLTAMQGGSGASSVTFTPQLLAGDLPLSGSRETFTRAKATERGLQPIANQDSGAQSPLSQSDWLIRRSPGDPAKSDGDIVPAIAF